ncbi:MAG: HEAT repeat domain-containing protein [Myxococcota bacterium]
MGLFDFFKRSKDDDSANDTKIDKNVARMGRVAADKRAQNYDRMEAIQGLATVGTADSAAALLKRFGFYIDPSITDQEEKEVAFRGILAAGDDAIEPIREFCVKAESFTWPMKMLAELLDEEAYIDELLVLLERFDTDYAKKQEPKLQIIAELEGKKREEVRVAVERFLDDFDERVRFHTVATLFSQEDEACAGPICEALLEEESVRVKNRIAEGFASRGWQVPEELAEQVAQTLPDGYGMQDRHIRQR